MYRSVRIAAVAIAAFLTLAAHAANSPQEKTLRWKFQPGELLHYRLVQDMKQTITVGGGSSPMAMVTTQTMEMTWRIESVDAQGAFVVNQTFDRISMKTQSAQGVLMEFDSASGKKPEGLSLMLASMFEAMVNKNIRIKFSPVGSILDMTLPQGMLENLNKMATSGQAGSGFFSEDLIKQLAESAVLPETPVAPGATWVRDLPMKDPLIGVIVCHSQYRYEGTEVREDRPLEKITTKIEFVRPNERPQTAVGLKQQGGDGTLYFDAQRGRLTESSSTTKMKIDMQVMGRSMNQDLVTRSILKLQTDADKSK